MISYVCDIQVTLQVYFYDIIMICDLMPLMVLKGTKLHFNLKSPLAERRHVLCVLVGGNGTHAARPGGARNASLHELG
jgi:hypothetical protein